MWEQSWEQPPELCFGWGRVKGFLWGVGRVVCREEGGHSAPYFVCWKQKIKVLFVGGGE